MSNTRTDRPREIERYIASRIKRLDDTALTRLLEQLRTLTATQPEQART
jgi:hypothetical protein